MYSQAVLDMVKISGVNLDKIELEILGKTKIGYIVSNVEEYLDVGDDFSFKPEAVIEKVSCFGA